MKHILFLLVILSSTILTADPAAAKAKFGVRVGEAYNISFKHGVSAGYAVTRYEGTYVVDITDKNYWGVAFGTSVPNDYFRPAPRISLSLARKMNDKVSLALSPAYQYNPGYSGAHEGHYLSFSLYAGYKLENTTLYLITGPGYTMPTGYWSWCIMPTIGYTF